jgi:hypothetical protein
MATLGVTIAFIAPGEVHLALPFSPNPIDWSEE